MELKFTLYFLLSFLLSYLITPFVLKISTYFKIGYAKVSERKIHNASLPQLGGIVIYASILIPTLLFKIWNQQILGIVLGGSLIFFIGILDDIIELKATIKFIVQIIASIITIYFGVKIIFITNPFGGLIVLGNYFAIVLTVIWIVGITNALNLIDGLDGLAGGVSLISALIFFLLAYPENQFILSITSFIAGTCLAFLRYNFYPAKIFMGDSGAYFLGFLLAGISIIGPFKSVQALTLFTPLLVLGFPILDTALSILRRLLKGESPTKPDREHIHHKLLEMGLSQRQSVVLIYFLSIVLGIIALLLARS